MSSGRGQAVTIGGTTVPTVLSIFLPGFVGPTGNDITNNWFRIPKGGLDLTNATAHIVMRTAAGTTDPIWDVLVSTDNGGSFTSILPATKLVATHGNKVTDLTPAWVTTSLDEGDLLRVDLTQTDDGSGADIEISIVLDL